MFSEDVVTVSRLVYLLQEVVEENFMQVAVEGEISNFAAPSSGHYYFSLKDSRCQLRAVMFRQHNRVLTAHPEDGVQVVCRGRLSVYPQRGDLQLLVDHLEFKGAGGLQAEYERLKQRLESEGLFGSDRKRQLPLYPQTVGVVTSPTGAAIQDILQVLRRRAAGVKVVLFPVRVQGDGAAGEIVRAIEVLNRHQAADVLIVGRGGGSLEDLWAFNEEAVTRAIFASRIPVISAVGHEVDVTIADLAADVRAPTPSAAAEIVARSCQEIETHLDHLERRLDQALVRRLARMADRLAELKRRLRSPRQVLAEVAERLGLQARRLDSALLHDLARRTARLERAAGRLEAYSPLRTLQRGYSIVTRVESHRVVRSAAEIEPCDRVSIRFAAGNAVASIEEVEP